MAYDINQYQDIFRVAGEIFMVDYINGEVSRIERNQDEELINICYSQECEEKAQLFLEMTREESTYEQTIVLIPSYYCNMECEYCYEGQEKKNSKRISVDEADRIIEYILQSECNHYNFILLGGEPIYGENIEFYKKFFPKIRKSNISYSISCVSNGLEISNYIDDIVELGIEKIQLTLDGTESVHNKRKVGKDRNKNPYQEVCKAVSLLLANNIYVLLRINVDINNVKYLTDIYRVIIENGWQNSKNFAPYIYPITYSGNDKNRLYLDESEIFEKVLLEIEKTPDGDKMFGLDFHGVDFIQRIINGDQFVPIKKFCASCKNQIVFDGNKQIYTCWWGTNSADFKIGKFDDKEILIDKDREKHWHNHSIETIEECRHCKYKFICGGGCVFKAHEIHGSIDRGRCSEFYRNIKLYFDYLMRKENMFYQVISMKHRIINETIKENNGIIISVEGTSMLPAIKNGERVCITGDLSNLDVGDIVLYCTDCKMKLHRVYAKKNNNIYTIKGDAETYVEDVHILDIYGKMSEMRESTYNEKISRTISGVEVKCIFEKGELMEVKVNGE